MIGNIDNRIRRALAHVRQAFRIVMGSTNSGPGIQLSSGEGLAGENIEAAELMQHYGYTSVPPAGTQAVVVPLGGKTSHSIIVATEHSSYRLKSLKNGEVAIYTDEKTKIVLKRGRIIDIECDTYRVNCKEYTVNASGSSNFNTPTLKASDEAIVDGMLTGKGGLLMSNESGGDSAVIAGTVKATVDVIAGNNNISLVNHPHIDSINGQTTPPIQ